MKSIFSFIRSVFAPSILGLVMLAMVTVIILAAIWQGSASLDTALDRMTALNSLESDARYLLNQRQLGEGYYIFNIQYGYDPTGNLESIAEVDTLIDDSLNALRQEGHFSEELGYAPEIAGLLDEFEAQRAAHNQTFEQLVAAIDAGNDDESAQLLEASLAENAALKEALSQVILLVEDERRTALLEFPEENNTGILISTVGITLLLILALVGYLSIAATTRSLRNLTNAVIAIGGDQYHPELLGRLLKRGGHAGRLARGLDKLARGLQERNAGMKAEVERLRQQLYESRRKRLKLARPTGDKEG